MQPSVLWTRARTFKGGPYIRQALLFVAGLLAARWFAGRLDPLYPIRYWLFLRVATIWAWQLFLSSAFLSAGHLLLRRVFRFEDCTRLETLSLSVGSGAVVFAMGMYAGGFLGFYGPLFAVALPGTMLIAGLPSAVPVLRTWLRERRQAPATSLLGLVALGFGTLCLGILYLGILSPDAVNYDASWNHLVIAQDYAREGRIVPFPADWVKNVPHLGSIFNTWAFLVPGLPLQPLRWMMALHDEFTFFLWTLVGVAAMTEWLTSRESGRGTWALFFLFPSIFVYDGNMGGAADHFLAFFVPPLCLAGARAFRGFDTRACALLGMLAAAAVLTKLHSFYVLGPMAVAGGIRLVTLAIRRLRRKPDAPALLDLLRGVAVAGATFIVVAAPHFVKNWVYYHNPLFPLAQRYFPSSSPTVTDAVTQIDYLFADWRWHPPTELGARLKAALEMVFSFSFTPHYSFVRELPAHGSLFTLALVFLPFLPRSRRLWVGVLMGMGALFFWASTFWVDRNLQTFEPLLVAATAGILVRAWKTGWLARAGVALLVAVQFAWGVEFYFSGSERISSAISLIKSGIDGRGADRFRQYRGNYIDLGLSLPKNATVLLHTQHIMLGINRRVFLDWMGFQGLIDYRTFRNPRDLYDRLRNVGVTHVVQVHGSHRAYTKQEEILFDTFSALYGEGRRNVQGLDVFPLPTTAPPEQAPLRVLSVGVWGYVNGVYPIEALSVCAGMPPAMQVYPPPSIPVSPTEPVDVLLQSVDAAMISKAATLDPKVKKQLAEFQEVSTYPELSIYARRPR